MNVQNSGNGSIRDAAVAIQANGLATIDNTSTSTQSIQGRVNAISAGSVLLKSNLGTIEGGSIAIKAVSDADITNSKTIQALGTGGIAIQADGTATIRDNTVGGTIIGTDIAISAATAHVVKNAGTIQGVNSAINAVANNVDSNAGTITATADAGAGHTAIAVVGNTVNIGTNSGTISETGAGGIAINGNNITIGSSLPGTGNLGTISADNSSSGTAIRGDILDITNSKSISAAAGTAIFGTSSTKIHNQQNGTISGGAVAITGSGLDVTNDAGATISTSANGIAIQGSGSVTNSGTITGGSGGSVLFNGGAGVTNTLTLKTGSQMTGIASGSVGGAVSNLVFQGHGTASNNFIQFDSLAVKADTSWVLSGNAGVGLANVNTGTLVVDGGLSGAVGVLPGATLAGHGTITGPLVVTPTGTVAPGAGVPFSTLTVNGSVNFQGSSVFLVNVNAAGQTDQLKVTGVGNTVTLTGGTVNVLAQNGTYALSTQYTILTAPGGLGGTNKFGGVTSNLAFLTPTLTYDPNNVFLTMALNNTGGGGGTGGGTGGTGGGTVTTPAFAAVAQTRNQNAVASSLAGGSLSNSLVLRVLNQTIAGARIAFDALSGELFGTVHNTQAQEGSFARTAILGRLRQASYADAPDELGALSYAGPELAYADGGAPTRQIMAVRLTPPMPMAAWRRTCR